MHASIEFASSDVSSTAALLLLEPSSPRHCRQSKLRKMLEPWYLSARSLDLHAFAPRLLKAWNVRDGIPISRR
jgi:hypothetical protein